MNVLVSVVIPVYNVEKYLDQCLSSIVLQTYCNLEIIVVNDGSSDKSPEMCDSWSKKDSRIKVLHQKNLGVTIARKNGVAKASGNWICFVDADDVLPVDAVEAMVMTIGDNDIVIGQISFKGPYKWPYAKIKWELNREQYLKALLKDVIHCGPYAKLLKKTLFDDFTFDIPNTIKCGEDYIMNLRLGNKAKKIQVIENIVYNYFYREGSAVTKKPSYSLSFVLMFNRFVSESIYPMSIALRWCMYSELLHRIVFTWPKENIKKIIK
jgi:glycosyltransferase involved in cell wall biosynthesis